MSDLYISTYQENLSHVPADETELCDNTITNEVQLLKNDQWHVGQEFRQVIFQEIFVTLPVSPLGSMWGLVITKIYAGFTKFSLSCSGLRNP